MSLNLFPYKQPTAGELAGFQNTAAGLFDYFDQHDISPQSALMGLVLCMGVIMSGDRMAYDEEQVKLLEEFAAWLAAYFGPSGRPN